MPTHFEATSASLGCHPCPVGDSPAEPAAHLRQTFPPAVIGAGKVEAASPGCQRSSIRPPKRLRGPSPPRGWGWAWGCCGWGGGVKRFSWRGGCGGAICGATGAGAGAGTKRGGAGCCWAPSLRRSRLSSGRGVKLRPGSWRNWGGCWGGCWGIGAGAAWGMSPRLKSRRGGWSLPRQRSSRRSFHRSSRRSSRGGMPGCTQRGG